MRGGGLKCDAPPRVRMEVEALHGRVWLYQRGDEQACQWYLIVADSRTDSSTACRTPLRTPPSGGWCTQGQRYFVERTLEDAKQTRRLRWIPGSGLPRLASSRHSDDDGRALSSHASISEIDEPVLTAAGVQMMLVHSLPRRDRQRIRSLSSADASNEEGKSFWRTYRKSDKQN